MGGLLYKQVTACVMIPHANPSLVLTGATEFIKFQSMALFYRCFTVVYKLVHNTVDKLYVDVWKLDDRNSIAYFCVKWLISRHVSVYFCASNQQEQVTS